MFMEDESLLPKLDSQSIFFTFGALALGILALIYFNGIFKPLVIAFLVWFIINQLKLMIQKITIGGKSLPAFVSGILAILVILHVLYFIVELLILNIEGIVASMPYYVENLNESFNNLSAFVNNPKYAEYLQKWINGLNLAGMAASFVNSLSGFVANSAVVIVYVIFFMLEDATNRNKIEKLFPEKGKAYQRFFNNLLTINKSIRSYIWQMTLISLITGGISYVILLIMGVEYAFLWSFLIFVLNFIPYIGPLISSLFPAIFAVIITGDPWKFLYVFAAMEGVQIILGNFVQPKLMGKGSNLSPITVLVSLAFWGMIWGIVGMIMAIPIMSVVVIICSQIPSARFVAILLSEKGEILKRTTN
jgi:predicted PurR-regulated permease PerM